MAALLKDELGIDAELVPGARREFTIRVGDSVLARKSWLGFPSDAKILSAVRRARPRTAG